MFILSQVPYETYVGDNRHYQTQHLLDSNTHPTFLCQLNAKHLGNYLMVVVVLEWGSAALIYKEHPSSLFSLWVRIGAHVIYSRSNIRFYRSICLEIE